MPRKFSSSFSFLYASLVLLGTALPLLVGWSHLPERVATHWARGGPPDGSASKLGAVLVLALIGLIPLLGLRSKRAVRAPAALATLTFVGLVASGTSLLIAVLNWDRGAWTAAGQPGRLGMILLLGVPVAAAAVIYAITRRFQPALPPQPGAQQALSLAAGERAYWSGSASNRWLWPLALALVILAVAVASSPASGRLGLVGPIIGLLGVAAFAKLRVILDARGVVIRYGLLGWPRQRIPLARIRSAEAFELVPLAHGGWGYRGSLRALGRAAVVVRGGDALRLELEGDKRLSITVDDAESAAKLLNAFIARR
jgi:hypothetical protein